MKTNTEIVNNQRLMVMLNINKIFNNDRLLRATTGLNLQAFDHLLVDFTKVYHEEEGEKESPRIRKIGGGRKAKLTTMEAKLFYILFYITTKNILTTTTN